MGAITEFGRPPNQGDPDYKRKMAEYQANKERSNNYDAKKPFNNLAEKIGGIINELEELFKNGLLTQKEFDVIAKNLITAKNKLKT